jgi:uncharacterized membrane protein (DUF441 family)
MELLTTGATSAQLIFKALEQLGMQIGVVVSLTVAVLARDASTSTPVAAGTISHVLALIPLSVDCLSARGNRSFLLAPKLPLGFPKERQGR